MNLFARISFAAIFALGCRTVSKSSLLDEQAASGRPRPRAESVERVGEFNCIPVATHGKTQRFDCAIGNQTVHMLIAKGNFVENAEAHAFLLAHEAEEGPLQEIEEQVTLQLGRMPPAVRAVANKLLECLVNRIEASLTQDFSDALAASEAGYRSKLGSAAKYNQAALWRGALGIELGTVLEYYADHARTGDVARLQALAGELMAQCGSSVGLSSEDLKQFISSGLASMFLGQSGCSGLVVAGPKTKDGLLIHGRNLDGDALERWNRHPTVSLIAEPEYHKFIAVAPAGVFYPGGVSGFNEHGISVSIHQMYATHPRVMVPNRKAALAPYVLQNILRRAASIDEAVGVAKSFEHLAAWTILVSDGRTGEAASIEIAPGKTIISRRITQEALPQSNHFFSPEMQGEAYFPFLNKRLETLSRAKVLGKAHDAATANSIDEFWLMQQLSSHEDGFEGPRAFGRTVNKVYSLLSTVAVPTVPAGQLPRFWFSIGDQLPFPHSTYAGFTVDFTTLTAKPIEARRGLWTQTNWVKSLGSYIEAHLANRRGDNNRAAQLIEQAIGEAGQDGIREPAYEYIRARLEQSGGKHAESFWHFKQLDSEGETLGMHPYQRVLVRLNALIENALLPPEQQLPPSTRQQWIDESKVILKNLREDGVQTDIDYKLNLLTMLKLGYPVEPKSSVDFVLVE